MCPSVRPLLFFITWAQWGNAWPVTTNSVGHSPFSPLFNNKKILPHIAHCRVHWTPLRRYCHISLFLISLCKFVIESITLQEQLVIQHQNRMRKHANRCVCTHPLIDNAHCTLSYFWQYSFLRSWQLSKTSRRYQASNQTLTHTPGAGECLRTFGTVDWNIIMY